MMILLNILLLLLGFAALIKGADFFVDGSSSIARTFKVPGVIIGLTIVAMGTSAPELAVSTSAALNGSNEIALSNVVGSNLFNSLMVLGVCALIRPVPIDNVIKKRDFPFSILITLLMFLALGIPALGTSLPELVTSVVASRKGENGMAVGNVVGSNLFNLMLILGVSGTIHPIAVNFASVIDLGILLLISGLIYVFCLTKKISRVEGGVMVLLYIASMVFAAVR